MGASKALVSGAVAFQSLDATRSSESRRVFLACNVRRESTAQTVLLKVEWRTVKLSARPSKKRRRRLRRKAALKPLTTGTLHPDSQVASRTASIARPISAATNSSASTRPVAISRMGLPVRCSSDMSSRRPRPMKPQSTARIWRKRFKGTVHATPQKAWCKAYHRSRWRSSEAVDRLAMEPVDRRPESARP